MKKSIKNILFGCVALAFSFSSGYLVKKNQTKKEIEQKIKQYITPKELDSYVVQHKSDLKEDIQKRVNFTYKLNIKNAFDQVMEIKHLKINKEFNGDYYSEIDYEREPTQLKIWKGKNQEGKYTGKIANFNLEGYGYAQINPNYFLSKKFLRNLEDSLSHKDSSIKIVGVDYYNRGIWLESIIYLQKNKKLDTLIINKNYIAEKEGIIEKIEFKDLKTFEEKNPELSHKFYLQKP